MTDVREGKGARRVARTRAISSFLSLTHLQRRPGALAARGSVVGVLVPIPGRLLGGGAPLVAGECPAPLYLPPVPAAQRARHRPSQRLLMPRPDVDAPAVEVVATRRAAQELRLPGLRESLEADRTPLVRVDWLLRVQSLGFPLPHRPRQGALPLLVLLPPSQPVSTLDDLLQLPVQERALPHEGVTWRHAQNLDHDEERVGTRLALVLPAARARHPTSHKDLCFLLAALLLQYEGGRAGALHEVDHPRAQPPDGLHHSVGGLGPPCHQTLAHRWASERSPVLTPLPSQPRQQLGGSWV